MFIGNGWAYASRLRAPQGGTTPAPAQRLPILQREGGNVLS
jgi:hypothetical protein